MEFILGTDPWPHSHHDQIQHYYQQYDAQIASGEFYPFVYPYGSYGALLVIVYLCIPHQNRPWLRKCRFLVWGILLAFAAYSIKYQRARGMAPALGLGLVHAWSVVYLAALLVFNDAQTDFQRIERTEGQFGSDQRSQQKKAKTVNCPTDSNGHVPQVSNAGPRDRHGEFAWQQYPLSPFIERLDWVCDLFCNFRGAGWNWRTSALPPPPKWLQDQLHRNSGNVPKHSSRMHAGQVTTYPDRHSLLVSNAKTLIRGYFILDGLKTIMMHDPYFWGLIERSPPSYSPFSLLTQPWMIHTYRLFLSMIAVKYALQTIFSLAPLVFAGIFGSYIGARAEPWVYPETWGSFSVVLDRGLAGWWSSWWHQTFRFAFEQPSLRIVEKLGLDRRSLPAKGIQLLTAFGLSGLLHACGTYTAAGPTRPVANSFAFFMLQALGIFLEVIASSALRRMGIQRYIPRWGVQLLATAGVSTLSLTSETYRTWIKANTWMMWLSLIGTFVFLGLTFWKRKSHPMNLAFLAGFTAMEAYSVSVIVSFYDAGTVLTALVFTLGIFVALSLFACQSKYDFTHWAPYLFGAVWVLILFGFMAAFFPYNSKVELGYGIVAALIFSGYILIDTQMIMRHYHPEEHIAAAISLYLDIINLFLAILRILNSQQHD